MAKSDEQLKGKGASDQDLDKNKDKGTGQPDDKGTSSDKGNAETMKRLNGQIKALQDQIKDRDTKLEDFQKKFEGFTTTVAKGLGLSQDEAGELTLDKLATVVANTNKRISEFQNQAKLTTLLSGYDLSDKARDYIKKRVDINAENLDDLVKTEVEELNGLIGKKGDGNDDADNNSSPFNRRPFSAGQMQPMTFGNEVQDANSILSEVSKDKK